MSLVSRLGTGPLSMAPVWDKGPADEGPAAELVSSQAKALERQQHCSARARQGWRAPFTFLGP